MVVKRAVRSKRWSRAFDTFIAIVILWCAVNTYDSRGARDEARQIAKKVCVNQQQGQKLLEMASRRDPNLWWIAPLVPKTKGC